MTEKVSRDEQFMPTVTTVAYRSSTIHSDAVENTHGEIVQDGSTRYQELLEEAENEVDNPNLEFEAPSDSVIKTSDEESLPREENKNVITSLPSSDLSNAGISIAGVVFIIFLFTATSIIINSFGSALTLLRMVASTKNFISLASSFGTIVSLGWIIRRWMGQRNAAESATVETTEAQLGAQITTTSQYSHIESMSRRRFEIQEDSPDSLISPFNYMPLGDDEIRLLEILPSIDTEGIECLLIYEELTNKPIYDAVSYCWGGGAATKVIEIDGEQFLVSQTLHDALRVFRSHLKDGPRYLWIDAVCINQSDNAKRASQVKMMAKIYGSAAELRIWLGMGDAQSEAAAVIFPTAFSSEEKVIEWLEDMSPEWYSYWYECFAEFFNLPWFCRAWVVQEYVLSATTNSTFYLGAFQLSARHISWENLSFFTENSMQEFVPDTTQHLLAEGLNRWSALEHRGRAIYRSENGARERTSLLMWLNFNRSARATVPSDMVYSILALVDQKHYDMDSLLIDYDASTQDVFSSVVRSIITKTKKLKILGSRADRSHIISRTWTTDWTMPSATHISTLGTYAPGEPVAFLDNQLHFMAAFDTEAIVSFEPDLSSMTVRGWIFDTIPSDSVYKEVRMDDENSSEFPLKKFGYQLFWETLADFRGYNSESGGKADTWKKDMSPFETEEVAYESEKAAKSSFWRTLLLNCAGVPSYINSDYARLEESMDAKYTLEDADAVRRGIRGAYFAEAASELATKGKFSLWCSQSLLSHLKPLRSHGKLFLASRGYVGKTCQGSASVEDGDVVCILLGCQVPVILRPVGDHYEFVRDAYVDGIMFGHGYGGRMGYHSEPRDFVLH